MTEKYNICDIFNICDVILKKKMGTDKEVQTDNLYTRKVVKRKRSEEYITKNNIFNNKYDSDDDDEELTKINNDKDLEEQIKSRWNFLNFLRY